MEDSSSKPRVYDYSWNGLEEGPDIILIMGV